MNKSISVSTEKIQDYIDKWEKELDKMRKDIEEKKKDFKRIYKKHVGIFFQVLDIFERQLKRTITEMSYIPIEDVKLELERTMRWIRENYYALKNKLKINNDSPESLLEAIIIDVSDSIGYYDCLPLVILNDKVKSLKINPLLIKSYRDSFDPVILVVNPIIAENYLFTPLIGHEVAHLLEKDHKDHYPEEMCCDYLATIVFGVSYILAQMMYVSEIRKDDLYNVQEQVHPPREFRISQNFQFLQDKIRSNIDKRIKQAYDKLKKDWEKKLSINPAPKKYGISIKAMKLDKWSNVALKHIEGIIKHYSIDEEMFIHNKHVQQSPLSLIHNSSINYIISEKEDKTIKLKILDYAKKIN